MFSLDFNTILFCMFLYAFYSLLLKNYFNNTRIDNIDIPSTKRSTSEVVIVSPTTINSTIHKAAGKLHCYVGPMFSGKTTAMLAKVVQCADVTNTSALIIVHSMDKGRSVGNGITTLGISSHNSGFSSVSTKLETHYTECLCHVDVANFDIIGLDECQLYPDLVETIKEWLLQGKHIYCSGLDGNFLTENFGNIHKLLPISDTFTKLCAVCQLCTQECPNSTPDMFIPAPFTAKIAGDRNVIVEQGGKDLYAAVCRYHFNLINAKKE